MTGPRVEVSPAHGFGQPTMRGVPTEVLADAYWSGETADTVADEYGLTGHELLVAWWFEATQGQPRFRRRWKAWANLVGPMLWRGDDPGGMPLPPAGG